MGVRVIYSKYYAVANSIDSSSKSITFSMYSYVRYTQKLIKISATIFRCLISILSSPTNSINHFQTLSDITIGNPLRTVFIYRSPTRLPSIRLVSMERMQQILRYRWDAASKGSCQACPKGRPSLSTVSRNKMVRFGEILQQRIFQLVKIIPHRKCCKKSH